MCGIAGLLESTRGDGNLERVREMTAALRHRGPDSEGFYVDGDIALGVRRLAIIDVAGGSQPIANEDGTVWAALNGEIYNFGELRRGLEERGHRFRTNSDAEVIVHAYEEAGENCVGAFDGMFALAIWDATRRRLTLARDRIGEKPLYYHAGADVFAFGSEVRALLQCPRVPRRLSLEGLSCYLAFECIPAPHSILETIAKLPPAHVLTVAPGEAPRLRRYWDPPTVADESMTLDEAAERVAIQLEASVRSQLVADVPVGLFVSGGIDSGAVVAAVSRAGRRDAIQTFTVGFAEATYDERPFARLVARQFGAHHQEVLFGATDARRLLPRVGELLDEPLADASFLPKYVLSQHARQTVKVVLSGDGGDELFCGYPTFLAERWARWGRTLLPHTIQRHLGRALDRIRPSPRYGSVEFLLKQFVRALPHPSAVSTQLLLGGLTLAEQAELFSPGVRDALRPFDPFEELRRSADERGGRDPLATSVWQHCAYYLAGQTLVAMDRASMAAGLEVRAPFLDRAMVELAGRIPSRHKLRGLTTKLVLKRALRAHLPAEVIHRRKQGLGVPTAMWLRGPLRSALDESLATDRLAKLGLFAPAVVARLIDEHVSGRRNHRKVLWALMMFDAWRDHYLPGERWT
ncbi:MAG: asparagine synthase (glutamine-hydrolyzing) [Candidatus Rokuibacteriota bacterium]|nr:MAG: asparagine synthase (glutamine-hydrolyzing) [Candidatus Rokubacteria bacterium]